MFRQYTLCAQKRQTQKYFDCLTRHKIPAYWLVVAMTRAKKNLTIVSGSRTETFSRICETVAKYCTGDGG